MVQEQGRIHGYQFLVACTRLYNPLCRLVGQSVDWSVGWLVSWSVGRSVGRLVGLSVGRSVGQSVGRSPIRSTIHMSHLIGLLGLAYTNHALDRQLGRRQRLHQICNPRRDERRLLGHRQRQWVQVDQFCSGMIP